MEDRVKGDAELREAIAAFLEIGAERNRMLHQDFGSFSLEKTASEIHDLYRKGSRFVDIVPLDLRKCASEISDPSKS